MTEQDLKNLLFKVSVISIHEISGGSTDTISVQEAIERISYTRTIANLTQIMDVNSISDSEKEITFAIAKEFIKDNYEICLATGLDILKWVYKLPKYDYGTEELLMQDVEGDLTMRSEESVVNWLIRGSIELKEVHQNIFKMELAILHKLLLNSYH